MTVLTGLRTGEPVASDEAAVLILRQTREAAADEIEKLRSDAMTMALRLMGEDDESFAPETREVMSRWRPKCLMLLAS